MQNGHALEPNCRCSKLLFKIAQVIYECEEHEFGRGEGLDRPPTYNPPDRGVEEMEDNDRAIYRRFIAEKFNLQELRDERHVQAEPRPYTAEELVPPTDPAYGTSNASGAANGRTNGRANGHANGRSNGYANGR